MQGCQHTCWRDHKDCAEIAIHPACGHNPIEIAVGVQREPRLREFAVGTVCLSTKIVERSQHARRRDFEDRTAASEVRTVIGDAADIRYTIEIPIPAWTREANLGMLPSVELKSKSDGALLSDQRQSLNVPREMMHRVGGCQNDGASRGEREPDQSVPRDLQRWLAVGGELHNAAPARQ